MSDYQKKLYEEKKKLYIVKKSEVLENLVLEFAEMDEFSIENRLTNLWQKAMDDFDIVDAREVWNEAVKIDREKRSKLLCKDEDKAPDLARVKEVKAKPTRPKIDLSEKLAYRKQVEDLAQQFLTQDNNDEMMERLSDGFVDEADLNVINIETRRLHVRALNFEEVSYIACVHRLSILYNQHRIEDGKHIGESPVNRAEYLTNSPKFNKIKNVGKLSAHHSMPVFKMLEKIGFAKCLEKGTRKTLDKNNKGKCGTYASEPSEWWGFPPTENTFPH